MNIIEFIIKLKDLASGEAKNVEASIKATRNAYDNLRASMKESESANNELRQAQQGVTEATERLAKAVRDLEIARQKGLESATLKAEQEQEKATDDLTKAFERLKKAENGAASASQDIASRVEKVRSLQDQLSRSTSASARDFRKLASAIQMLSRGNVTGAVSSLSSIAPALAKAVPVIGLVVVGLSKLRKRVQEFLDSKFEEALSDFKSGLASISEQAQTAANQIKHLREEISNLHAAQTRENQSNLKIDLSDIEAEEANLRIRTANKLANTTDPQKRAEIEEEAKQQKFAIDQKKIDRRYEAEVRQHEIDVAEAESSLAASEKELANLFQQLGKLQTLSGKIESKQGGAYMDWASRNAGLAKEIVDPIVTGFGLWGQDLEKKLKQGMSLNDLRTEIGKQLVELNNQAQSKTKSIADERNKVANLKDKGREEIDARHAAARRSLEADRAEHDARLAEQKWRDKAATDAKAKADAEARAAKDAEEAAKKREAHQAEIEKIQGQIEQAEIRKLHGIVQSSEAAAREADAMEAQAKAALEEAQNRKLGMDDLDAADAARKAAKEEAKKDRHYENMKDNIRRAWDNAKRFNPGISDDEIIKRMPRKWRDIIEQERKKNADIDAAVAKQNEAQKLRMEAEERRLEAEKKLEERWGIVSDIDKELKRLKIELNQTIKIDQGAGEGTSD